MYRQPLGVFASAALLLLSGWGAALADGDPQRRNPHEDPWSGGYLGGHVGYAWGHAAWTANGLDGAAPAAGPLDLFSRGGGLISGFQAGYNVLLPSRVLVGIEADITFPRDLSASTVIATPAGGRAEVTETVRYATGLRGRLGYAADDWLVYATGGFALSYDEFTSLRSAAQPPLELLRAARTGWTAGLGVEHAFAPNWTMQLQYLFTDYASQGVTFPFAAQRFATDLTSHDVRLGFNYHLDGAAMLPPAAPSTPEFNLHAQTTVVEQGYPRFRANYDGPQSLGRAGQGKETFDATFYLGLKLWAGAELWANPEIDQGFGVQSTFGVAGFPSGESYKNGADFPYTRLQRLFLRQTIDLGGTPEKVEADLNQFAGTRTANRLVLTLGRFAVTDIFDTNTYAHDPRGDFLNWSVIDAGSFDYAADAWGFTYGAAAEWVQDRWTLRAGVFDLSVVPNSTILDPSLRQFQMVAELERRHALWGQPGKLKLTGFQTRGDMGRFADAVALARAAGGPADIAAVRHYGNRGGVHVNLEQQLAPGIGLFARAGWADGRSEQFAFTDIDRTVAAGLAIAGTSWGRPNDTVGIAGVINASSGARQSYLMAGGLGGLIGDGQLPHPGLEKIAEAYYSLPILSWKATLDVQLIDNPGYNADRGPVTLIGGRLHAQF